MLKCTTTFLFSALSVATAMGQFRPIATTRIERAISAKTDQGEIFVTARKLLLDVALPKWPSGKGLLFVLFDSSSGYFLWSLGRVPKTQQTAGTLDGSWTRSRFYIAADRLVYFFFGQSDLLIMESRAKANNLNDAEGRALSEAARRDPVTLGSYKSPDRVWINIGKLLPRDGWRNFCAPPDQPICGPMKLVDVIHKGNTWEVIVEGQWQQKFTLDDKYQVTATARIN